MASNDSEGWCDIDSTTALRLFASERISQLLKRAVAPLFACGLFVLCALFLIGVFLVWRLIELAWFGNADENIRAASAALTAIAAVFGAVFLAWRTTVAHWQARASQHQVAISRESHYTTLFTKAVEQLGATREVKVALEGSAKTNMRSKFDAITRTEPNLEVRLGAIYALERIAHDSERDHWSIMEVLCAYVRNPQNCGVPLKCPTGASQGDKAFDEWLHSIPSIRIDVQAALKVIGRRPSMRKKYEQDHGWTLNLSRVNLQGAIFNGGDFSRTNFKHTYIDNTELNSTMLHEVNFWGASAHCARFFDADARGSCFAAAKLDSVVFGRAILNDCLFYKAELWQTSFFSSATTHCAAIFNRPFKRKYLARSISRYPWRFDNQDAGEY